MFQNTQCHQLELQLFYLTRSLCLLRYNFSLEIHGLSLSFGKRMVLSSRSKAADISRVTKVIFLLFSTCLGGGRSRLGPPCPARGGTFLPGTLEGRPRWKVLASKLGSGKLFSRLACELGCFVAGKVLGSQASVQNIPLILPLRSGNYRLQEITRLRFEGGGPSRLGCLAQLGGTPACQGSLEAGHVESTWRAKLGGQFFGCLSEDPWRQATLKRLG